jgi:hypothetical protein
MRVFSRLTLVTLGILIASAKRRRSFSLGHSWAQTAHFHATIREPTGLNTALVGLPMQLQGRAGMPIMAFALAFLVEGRHGGAHSHPSR